MHHSENYKWLTGQNIPVSTQDAQLHRHSRMDDSVAPFVFGVVGAPQMWSWVSSSDCLSHHKCHKSHCFPLLFTYCCASWFLSIVGVFVPLNCSAVVWVAAELLFLGLIALFTTMQNDTEPAWIRMPPRFNSRVQLRVLCLPFFFTKAVIFLKSDIRWVKNEVESCSFSLGKITALTQINMIYDASLSSRSLSTTYRTFWVTELVLSVLSLGKLLITLKCLF